jgi:tRNA dimethylallyltransferase
MEQVRGSQENPKVIVILGPTASGKSKLAVSIASALKCCVLSIDSLQVYREFGVVSDKVSIEEQKGVKHFGIDILAPNEEINVADFISYAVRIIEDELRSGRNCVVVGGTNMYIDKLLFTSRLDQESPKNSVVTLAASQHSYTYEHLQLIDPLMANCLHPNDIRRVSRAIDYYYNSGGKKLSGSLSAQTRELRWSNLLVLVKSCDAEALLESNIRARIENKMIKSGGLERELDKIERMIAKGTLKWNRGILQAIGYREFELYLTRKIDSGFADLDLFNKAVDDMTRSTIRYAKKQKKWIRKFQTYVDTLIIDDLTEDILIQIKSAGSIRVKTLPQWRPPARISEEFHFS